MAVQGIEASSDHEAQHQASVEEAGRLAPGLSYQGEEAAEAVVEDHRQRFLALVAEVEEVVGQHQEVDPAWVVAEEEAAAGGQRLGFDLAWAVEAVAEGEELHLPQ